MKDISIRMASPADARQLLSVYEPYVRDTAITFEYDVPSEADFVERIAQVTNKYPWLVAERGGEILGYAYASAFKNRAAYDWAVETSIYVRQDMQGAGLGRRLHDALEGMLRRMNICNMNACIAVPIGEDPFLTDGSIGFHGRLGYRMVGRFSKCGYKFGRWYDMVWMEKIIGEHRDSQPDVIPVRDLDF